MKTVGSCELVPDYEIPVYHSSLLVGLKKQLGFLKNEKKNRGGINNGIKIGSVLIRQDLSLILWLRKLY